MDLDATMEKRPVNITDQKSSSFCPRLTTVYQKWRDMEYWPKTFYVIAIINYLCLTALAVEPLFENGNSPPSFSPTILTRTGVFLVIIFFQNVHVFYGIFYENIYELYATMITQFGTFVIIVLRSIFLPPPWDVYSLLLLSYGIIFLLVYLFFAPLLYRAYAWSFYYKAGADVTLRRKFRNVLLFNVFLKLDCMVSLINILVFENKTRGIVVPCGILAIVYFILGRIAHTHESIPLTFSFWFLSLANPVFIGYGLYTIVQRKLLEVVDFMVLSFGEYDPLVFAFLFTVSSIFFAVSRVMLLAQSIIIFRYYGEGIFLLEQNSTAYWATEDDALGSSETESGTVIRTMSGAPTHHKTQKLTR